MKILRRLLPVLLALFSVLSFAGCSQAEKANVEEVVMGELDLLKNLDSDTTMKYISYKELFPDATQNTELSDKIKEVFSLFFQDFDYKILDIDVNQKKKTASVSLNLSTLDAQALAKDFCAVQLKGDILEAASGSANTEDTENSLEERYLLLNDLLTSREYGIVDHKCSIMLENLGDKESVWEIKRTYSLEDDLVGGLMTYLSDPNILPPEDTLTVYLETLKDMNTEEMCSYLGLDSLLNSDDSARNSIASALVNQVHTLFDFQIKDSSTEGYSAYIEAEITSFDSEAIMSAYQKELDEYLAQVDAVLDGASVRYEKSLDMLLKHIDANTETATSIVSFHLENDGVSWKLSDNSTVLGTAVFGSLAQVPEEDLSDYDDSGDDTGDYDDSESYDDSGYYDEYYDENYYDDSYEE